MKTLAKTIDLLRQVIQDPHCSRMNRSGVKGYLGELLVLQKLRDEGLQVVQRGNQSGYDLEAGEYKIDVKLSTTKFEVDRVTPSFGWALVHQNKKRDLTCTHFVCAALDEKYEVAAFYIVPQASARKFPGGAGQFRGVKHGFCLLAGKRPKLMKKGWGRVISESERLLREGAATRVRPGGSLKRALRAA